MDELLRFFRTYEPWMYALLGLGALVYFRRFALSWRALRSAVFGLEREGAQAKLNQAASMLILLVLLSVAVFVLVSFVAPMYPQANPLLTPTLNVLATSTATITPSDGTREAEAPVVSPSPEPTLELGESVCVPGALEISSPTPGEYVSGEIPIIGSATATNFGFYKLEYATLSGSQTGGQWLAIQAGRVPVIEGVLVQTWDTTTLDNLEYLLRLVVTDNTGAALPDCRVLVRVNNP